MENNQREITHIILKPELWFLCMTHRLIMLNKCTCTKFYCKILNGFQVIERTQNCIENNQREVTPKILKLELWFLCMTDRQTDGQTDGRTHGEKQYVSQP